MQGNQAGDRRGSNPRWPRARAVPYQLYYLFGQNSLNVFLGVPTRDDSDSGLCSRSFPKITKATGMGVGGGGVEGEGGREISAGIQ